MESIVCKECGKIFSNDQMKYALREFYRHLMYEHKMSKGEYFIKNELGGEIPVCSCGCGFPVKTKKGWNIWHKYYLNHKDTMPMSDESKQKLREINKIKRENLEFYKNVNKSLIEESFCDFKNSMSLVNLSKKYNYDKRTLRDMWIAFGKCTKSEYRSITAKNNSILGIRAKRQKVLDEKEYYEKIFNFIIANPYVFTIREVNRKHGFKHTDTTVIKNLMMMFGEERVIPFLKCGSSSKEEDFFFSILRFYLGRSNVKQGFKLEGKLYDGFFTAKY
jgi:hypothetical protein